MLVVQLEHLLELPKEQRSEDSSELLLELLKEQESGGSLERPLESQFCFFQQARVWRQECTDGSSL